MSRKHFIFSSKIAALSLILIAFTHVAVLLTSRAEIGFSAMSQLLQACSVFIALICAVRLGIRSDSFTRNFWLITSVGFGLLLLAIALRTYESQNVLAISDFVFFIHMLPFGVALLLSEDSPPKPFYWPTVFDVLQVCVIAGVVFAGVFYLPGKSVGINDRVNFYLLYAIALITRNVLVTSAFILKLLLSRSVVKHVTLFPMTIYLSIYSIGSIVTHSLFLTVTPAPLLLELQGSIPFLAVAWLSTRSRHHPHILPSTSVSSGVRQVLSLHLIPTALPGVVMLLSLWFLSTARNIALMAMFVSAVLFAFRLLATVYSEYRVSAALYRSERRYRSLVEAGADIVWTASPEGELSVSQESWRNFTGPVPLVGTESDWSETVHPEDRNSARQVWKKAMASAAPFSAEFRIQRWDGAYRDMLMRGAPVSDEHQRILEWIGTCIDVTDRNQYERAAESSRRQLREFVQNAPFGMGRVSFTKDRFLTANRALSRILGYEEQYRVQILSLDFSSLYSDRVEYDQLRLELQRNERVERIENRWRHKDGFPVIVRINGVRANEENTESLADLIVEDITEERFLEDQLHQSRKMETIGRLTGGIAHDFNNSLSVILGHSAVLEKELSGNERLKSRANAVSGSAKQAAAIVKQLLAFSRKQILQPRAVNLNQLLSDFVAMLGPMLGDEIDIKMSLAPEVWQVKVDYTQMQQVMMNLALNARDAMPHGGRITIKTHNRSLKLPAIAAHFRLPKGEYVIASVTDTGAGMTPHTMEHLFEPFFTTKESGKGTGLGLASVYGIVRQSGGYIVVSSVEGQGSSFDIYLPRANALEAQINVPTEIRPDTRGSTTVLVVEDSAALREFVSEGLTAVGYSVLTATNGVDALRKAEACQSNLDIVITDLSMPSMGGMELAERIHVRHPETKVLYMSGYPAALLSDEGRIPAGHPFIQKPFELPDLDRVLQQVLS
ncbi:MAG TPA: PAS domain S-box protein [Terriglobales bacterium]|nr:PAS domain S-box protein [Terriglobales bacterium]